ncbi:MAG TPA: helix-turn-helix domain-containing protein [Chitinophagaceae bacterium]|nr:helix-turn-helix domain-containing protein [Chitinophagaceae bacterium]
MANSMQVICLEEEAFYALIEQVVARLKEKYEEKEKWISDVEAMQLLKIKSKTTLQDLRNKGKIRYSQPQKKMIVYDRESIMEYLENNAKNRF